MGAAILSLGLPLQLAQPNPRRANSFQHGCFLSGLGFIRYRYADPLRGDDSWEWLPGSRRIRRLNESIMSSRSGAQAWDPDHYSGFNPKTEWYDYKMLGKKNMLACAHAEHWPEIRCNTDNGTSACPEVWEMRRMYVVEAQPRAGLGKAGNVLDGKTLIYMDSEMWFEPYIDTYDRQGQPVDQSHLLPGKSRSPGARREGRDLSVQALVRGRRSLDRYAGRSLNDVLSARDRDA